MRLQERILDFLETVDRPISAPEIAGIIKANPKSVRSRLTRMFNAGLIVREYRGHYRVKPRYGVGGPPRLQNLLVVADKSKNPELKGLIKHYKTTMEFPSPPNDTFRVSLEFGEKRDKIHWTVKAPVGIDYYGFLMTRAWVESEVKSRLGIDMLNWDVSRYDLLFDTFAIRLEGISVVTLDDLQGTLEKYYNKFYGIRKEVHQTPKSASFDQLVSLVSGGIPAYQMTGSLALLVNKIDKMSQHIGLFVETAQSDRKVVKAIMTSQFRISDLLDRVSKRLDDMEGRQK